MLVFGIQNAGRSQGQEQRESWFPSGGWWQLVERSRHGLAGYDEVSEQPFIDIQITFVFPEIPNIVALCQHAPYSRTETERMRQYLENDISVRSAISEATQRSETQRVRRVIGEIEAACHGDAGVLRIGKPRVPRPSEAGGFLRVRRFLAKGLARTA